MYYHLLLKALQQFVDDVEIAYLTHNEYMKRILEQYPDTVFSQEEEHPDVSSEPIFQKALDIMHSMDTRLSERPESPLPIHNLDYIRTLPAEELALFLDDITRKCSDVDCFNCHLCPNGMYECDDEGILKWLLSERPESPLPVRNIDYIRTLPVEELTNAIHNFIYICEEGDCHRCPFDYECTISGIKEWLLSERTEKEDSDE